MQPDKAAFLHAFDFFKTAVFEKITPCYVREFMLNCFLLMVIIQPGVNIDVEKPVPIHDRNSIQPAGKVNVTDTIVQLPVAFFSFVF
jgi:hypothetical protein